MQFANPEYLYLLIVLPLLVVLFWLNRRAGHKRLLRLGKAEYVRRLMAEVSETRVWVKFSLLMAALAMIVLMLARPRMGMRLKTDTLSGIEVVVAMDISNSMLANDVEPSRLEKAKQVVGSLCSRLRNDKIALVIFAGNAFLQMPMSADNVSVRMFLDAISTTMIPAQGTSIAEALRISNGSFSAQKDVKRAVVVITDGEDHEGGVEDALSDLRKKGVSVYVLGIGSSKGSSIRMGNDYLRDAEGNVVVTRLNEDMCRQIAKAADGTYIHIDNSNSAQDQLVDELNQLQRSNLSSNAYEEYNDLFPWLAVVTLVLLVLEVVIQSRRSHYFEGWNLFGSHRGGKALMLLLLLTVPLVAAAQSPTKVQTHKGNVSFTRNLDSLAVIYYKKAIALDSTNFKAHYNLGNTYMRQGKAQDAIREYEKSATLSPSRLVKAAIYHNIGVLNQSAKQFEPAIDAYKKSLRAYPLDNRTRYNLALCQHQRQKNPNQPPPSPQNKDDKQGQDKNKQDQQKQDQQQQDPNKQQQQQHDQMSKQNAEQMLRAVEMKERETQDKLKRKAAPAGRRRFEKNW